MQQTRNCLQKKSVVPVFRKFRYASCIQTCNIFLCSLNIFSTYKEEPFSAPLYSCFYQLYSRKREEENLEFNSQRGCSRRSNQLKNVGLYRHKYPLSTGSNGGHIFQQQVWPGCCCPSNIQQVQGQLIKDEPW